MPHLEIIHLGGGDTVTGSCHFFSASNVNILVDCGLVQGDARMTPFADWPVPPADIDYLFLTHAHIDHIGRLPELIEAGFAGEILCSHPTRALLVPMLLDGLRFSDRRPSVNQRLMDRIDQLAWGFEYNQLFDLKKGIRFKLSRAGHILGSCFLFFELPQPGKDPYRVIFSGDLGNFDTPILPDPDPPDSCDLLVLESTYGDRIHQDRRQRTARLGVLLDRTLADHGKIFIPAFALGRTQELLYELDRVMSGRPMDKKIPVFLDSPLALQITEVYSSLETYWDQEAKDLQDRDDHPFDFSQLYSVGKFREHQELLRISGPAIILAGSGMCTGGRIINHLAAGLGDARNDIFFVGYQAAGTLGRSIQRYGAEPGGWVKIDDRRIEIRAKIHNLSGYSAHADSIGLVNWVKKMPEKPGKIRLVHGEAQARRALAEELQKDGYKVNGGQ